MNLDWWEWAVLVVGVVWTMSLIANAFLPEPEPPPDELRCPWRSFMELERCRRLSGHRGPCMTTDRAGRLRFWRGANQ